MYEAPALSGIRTAAIAVWAIRQVYNDKKINSILIIGKGRVGTYLHNLVTSCVSATQIDIIDKDETSKDDWSCDYDVVITATTSTQPFITKKNCKASLLISVGADTHFNHELHPSFFNDRVFCTDIDEALNVGDLEALKT